MTGKSIMEQRFYKTNLKDSETFRMHRYKRLKINFHSENTYLQALQHNHFEFVLMLGLQPLARKKENKPSISCEAIDVGWFL